MWASREQEPAEVLAEAFAEAPRRDPQHQRPWMAVGDGNEHQLNLLERLRAVYGVERDIVRDFLHVCEYGWKAAHALCREGSAALEQWVRPRLERILRGQAVGVAAGMRRRATRRGPLAARRKPVDVCADSRRKSRADHASPRYLARGSPFVSGVIEGAGRHLVKDRRDLTGARWSLRGADAVLTLRALRASAAFHDSWRFHEAREQARHHRSQYPDNRVPEIIRPDLPARRSAHLRCVT